MSAVIDAKRADYPITVTAGSPPSSARRTSVGRRFYGSPRIHFELTQAHQVFVSRKRVIRIMQQEGLRARVRKRFKCTTMSEHDQPIAPNLLAQDFRADRPNQRWVGDTTELVTGDGMLYLAVIVDLFSRFVVGWRSPR